MTDVVVIGAGAAGAALAVEVARSTGLSVALLEAPAPSASASPDRTWCFWERPTGAYDDILTAAWDDVLVVGPDGVEQRLQLAPFRYTMLSSRRYLQRQRELFVEHGGRLLTVEVLDAWEDAEGPHVRGVDERGAQVRIDDAQWVFDTRPTSPSTRGTARLLQHFRGWFVEVPAGAIDPTAAVLMDFRTPQPARGVSFGYVLPTSTTTALVEYTEFGPAVLTDAEYDAALRNYLERIVGVRDFAVTAVENGVIPMTDAVFRRSLGRRTFRLGAAGGATRPSTGYTFAAAQRQASAVAQALAAGTDPTPPPAYPARHVLMDGVLLRALDRGRIDGARFFADLFAQHDTERVVRFLDGATTPAEELAIMRSSPRAAMLRSVLPG